MEEALTLDDFLGGRLRIRQPAEGYRAGVDPVFLAAAVPAGTGETVLELGCGVGVASLCLGRRVSGLRLTGVERQESYAALCRENAELNGIGMEVITVDLAALPDDLRARSFDHVIANPPYYLRSAGTAARDAGREAALGEETPLGAWMEAATRRLRPGGRLTVIQAAERLQDLLTALDGRLGAVTVHPLAPREGRAARRVIVSSVKGSRAAFRLEAPTVLHAGPAHAGDGDDYTHAARAVLREGATWPWISAPKG